MNRSGVCHRDTIDRINSLCNNTSEGRLRYKEFSKVRKEEILAIIKKLKAENLLTRAPSNEMVYNKEYLSRSNDLYRLSRKKLDDER